MIEQLLERQAERGAPRGAAAVWADANRAGLAPEGATARPGRQRVMLWAAVGVVAVLALGLVRLADVGGSAEVDAGPSADTTDRLSIDDRLPGPLLVDGMDLIRVNPPIEPGTCCDDDLLDRLGIGGRSTPSEVDLGGIDGPSRVQVFARADDPSAGPVLGVEHLPGGGFRPWAVNLGGATLESLTTDLERVGEDWRLDPSSALVEVADLPGEDPFAELELGWQFDFERDGRLTILQAAPAEQSSVWRWVARLMAGGGQDGGLTLESVTVGTGTAGFALISEASEIGDQPAEVLWQDDGWVNRLSTSRIEGDTAFGADARPVAGDVVIVDRAQWWSAVDGATDRSTIDWAPGWTGLAQLVGAAVLVLVAAIWVTTRTRLLGLVVVAVVAALAFVSGPVPAPAVVGLVVGTLIALIRRRRRVVPIAGRETPVGRVEA